MIFINVLTLWTLGRGITRNEHTNTGDNINNTSLNEVVLILSIISINVAVIPEPNIIKSTLLNRLKYNIDFLELAGIK